MKYRKKPIVIEARQWHPGVDVAGVVPLPDHVRERLTGPCADLAWIDTSEGGHTVSPGDWIITGIKGERYPCKPDVFAATYEPAPCIGCTEETGPQVECPTCGHYCG